MNENGLFVSPTPVEFGTFALTLRSTFFKTHPTAHFVSENILENVISGELVSALIAQTLCDI